MLSDYELVDVSGGRKRERFGKYVVDRPAIPLASALIGGTSTSEAPPHPRPLSGSTELAEVHEGRGEQLCVDFVYERDSSSTSGRWQRGDGSPVGEPVCWNIAVGQLTFELRLTDSGQVGLFPEQADNWRWIAEQIARLTADRRSKQLAPPRLLNLFAYTGASTLAAAVAGAHIAHVDAARPVVQWARRNAELSGLSASQIRWLVDDARAFVRRELRRGRDYEGIVLDPPSYGHGVKGQDWRLERDLPELLTDCRRLLDPERAFMLLTCHTTGVTREQLGMRFEQATGWRPSQTIDMDLKSATGDSLHSGVCVRWATK